MDKLIKSLEEYNEILKAFSEMITPMIKNSEKAVRALKKLSK